MFTWGRVALWRLDIRVGALRLWLPLPLFVLAELLRDWADLLELILPRLGHPNYAALLWEVVDAIGAGRPAEPLLDVRTGDVRVICGRVGVKEG